MTVVMVNDPVVANDLIAQRKAQQADRFDEVWEGVYMMSPMANNEHQRLATELSIAIGTVVDWKGLGRTFTGANVSDRRDDWTKNYRVPDVLVFSRNTAAVDCDTHWFGGPELAIEIVSPGDRTLDKLDFYAAVGTQELLVIDREPWQVTLYRVEEPSESDRPNRLKPAAMSTMSQPIVIALQTFPLRFQITSNPAAIEVSHGCGDPIRAIPIQSRAADRETESH